MAQAQEMGKGSSGMKLSRRQREAVRFVRFREEYRRNDSNAYRAALAAGYSESMARAKSYRLGRLAQAAEQLERLGFTLVAVPNFYHSAVPAAASSREGLQARANKGANHNHGGAMVEQHLDPSAPVGTGVAPDEVSQAATKDIGAWDEDSEDLPSGNDGGKQASKPRVYRFAQLRRRRPWFSYHARPIVPDTKP